MSEICGICFEKTAKYKCPKCSVRYCSLSCYKDLERHIEPDGEKELQDIPKETKISTNIISQNVGKTDPQPLATPYLNEVYEDSLELKELLQYNTVKFHLAKVHRILTTEVADSGDSTTNMSSDMKNQLAIDYLNTLRYGGIHYNEAIEEFCQIYLAKIENNTA